MPNYATLLESGFPYVDVSRLVDADRRAPDPAYQAHRWWARRPPALLRAALLASVLPETTSLHDFWAAYGDEAHALQGMTVVDPFLGGGTTLVEGARLGATMRGQDVDPLAVLISEHQMEPPAAADVLTAGALLGAHLETTLGELWPLTSDPDGKRWRPLHYFSLATVTCPSCYEPGRLYRSLVIARSVGRAGAVVRDVEVTAFCPDCLALHRLAKGRKTLTCCSSRRQLTEATYSQTKYACRTCGKRSTHEQLQTGAAPRTVLAVEETPVTGPHSSPGDPETENRRRRIREPNAADMNALALGRRRIPSKPFGDRTSVPLAAGAKDRRPLSYGIHRVADLHTSRQIAYLTEALTWIETADLQPAVKRALRLAVSTTITCNNRLCGYATDYGRLSPLFSVRAFALPALTVELNPLNPTGGRGTLAAAVTRVAQSCVDDVKRNVIALASRSQASSAASLLDLSGHVRRELLHLTRERDGHLLTCTDSTADRVGSAVGAGDDDLADICMTDPPYFDFISYDALSQVFRVWLTGKRDLSGEPMLPFGEDPVTRFGTALGAALRNALKRCKKDALVAFTYKGGEAAWNAVGIALDEAKLRVTALWPVLADPHMGHHTHEGNCEYDVLVVARPIDTVDAIAQSEDDVRAIVATQLAALRSARSVLSADEMNLTLAMRMASTRRAVRSSGD